MKRNAYTPVHTTPRVSDTNGYAYIHTDGYADTDYAYALYKSKSKDLEFIRIDMTIYSYIMEGWC